MRNQKGEPEMIKMASGGTRALIRKASPYSNGRQQKTQQTQSNYTFTQRKKVAEPKLFDVKQQPLKEKVPWEK